MSGPAPGRANWLLGGGGKKHVGDALALLVFFYLLGISLMPLADPDLFWHLRTGQLTLQDFQLPGSAGQDIFSYTVQGPLDASQVAGLRSQWLGQVAIYSVYAAFGYSGLIFMRALMTLLPFVFIYAYGRKRGLGAVQCMALTLLPVLLIILSLHYTFERPQAFTFLMTLSLLWLLWRLRGQGGQGGKATAVALVAMMALWSNLHGGFIFGVAVLAVFALGVLGSAAIRRSGRDLWLVPFSALAAAATLLNPNTYRTAYAFLSSLYRGLTSTGGQSGGTALTSITGVILEFKPLWFFVQEFHYVWPVYMMAFIGLVVLAVAWSYAERRGVDAPELLVVLLVAGFGLYFSRGVTLSLLVLPFLAVGSLAAMGRLPRVAFTAVALLLALALVVTTVKRSPWQLRPSLPTEWVDAAYPEGALQFMREHDVRGPVFNDLLWGGYVIWRAWPRYRVFTDTRLLSREVLGKYRAVTSVAPGYERILQDYAVEVLLVPVFSVEAGRVEPLALRFMEQEPQGWSLVYLQGNSAVIVRNAGRNRGIASRMRIPYKVLNVTVLQAAERALAMMPGHPGALGSKAVALYGMGRYDEARRIFLRLAPSPLRDAYLRKLPR